MSLQNDLPRLAQQLQAQPDIRKRRATLRREMPRFYRHLRRIVGESDVLDRWGWSANEDELANQTIVDPLILELIGDVVGVDLSLLSEHSRGVYHAGVQHTYGYLLSLIETPYGFKRNRWLTGTIEDGFGLPTGSLHAFPSRGTLLGNLTTFLSSLVLRDQPPVRLSGTAARFDFDGLRRTHRCRIVERIDRNTIANRSIVSTVQAESSQSEPTGVSSSLYEIFTDLFSFQRPSEHSDSLLVYSVKTNGARAKLITTFPISRTMRTELLEEGRFGNERPIQLRFNAFLPGLPTKLSFGQRMLHHK